MDKDSKMNKDVDMIEKNAYSRNDQEGKIKFSCDNCKFEAEKESLIKKHVIQSHVAKPGKQAGKKRKVMESAKKESVPKERRLTEVEDDDDSLSVSMGDFFEDNFSSTQIDQDNIEKLLEECRKDLIDDEEYEEVPDKTEDEEKKDEPTESMAKQLKEMEEKYDLEKENNKVLQGRNNYLEELKITNEKTKRA